MRYSRCRRCLICITGADPSLPIVAGSCWRDWGACCCECCYTYARWGQCGWFSFWIFTCPKCCWKCKPPPCMQDDLHDEKTDVVAIEPTHEERMQALKRTYVYSMFFHFEHVTGTQPVLFPAFSQSFFHMLLRVLLQGLPRARSLRRTFWSSLLSTRRTPRTVPSRNGSPTTNSGTTTRYCYWKCDHRLRSLCPHQTAALLIEHHLFRLQRQLCLLNATGALRERLHPEYIVWFPSTSAFPYSCYVASYRFTFRLALLPYQARSSRCICPHLVTISRAHIFF